MAKNKANIIWFLMIIFATLSLLLLKSWHEISMLEDLIALKEIHYKNESILKTVINISCEELKKNFNVIHTKLKRAKSLEMDCTYLFELFNSSNLLSHLNDLSNYKLMIYYSLPAPKKLNPRKELILDAIIFNNNEDLAKIKCLTRIDKNGNLKVKKLYEA